MTLKRNGAVDLLKCYAAIIVFVCHAYIVSNEVFGYEFTSSWQFILKTPAWAGVWIFVMVSGFLAGTGFFSGKYELNKSGIISYYKNRFLNVIVPTWIMISLVYILAEPQVPSLEVVLRYLTCMFRGSGGASGVGATWYIFSIAWLYLLTPLFVRISRWIEGKWVGREVKAYFVLFLLLAFAGLTYRIGGRIIGLQWYQWIYASPIGNIDLFFGGLLISRIRAYSTDNGKKDWGTACFGLIIFTSLFCAFCYYFGETTKPALLSVYRYIMPTAFLILVGGYYVTQKITQKIRDGARCCIMAQYIHSNSICGIL